MCAVSNCRNVLVKVGHDNVFDAVYRDFEAKKNRQAEKVASVKIIELLT